MFKEPIKQPEEELATYLHPVPELELIIKSP